MVSQKKILYVCQQVAPYISDGVEAERCTALLHAMHDHGFEVRTFMPRYGLVNERRNQLHEVKRLSGMPIVIDGGDSVVDIKVASMPSSRLQIYFIDSDEYFVRKAVMKDEKGEWFADNDVRSRLFAKGVLKAVNMLRWEPTVVHCHGWFSAFAAVYLKEMFKDDPIYANTKVVVSFDNDTFEGALGAELCAALRAEGIAEQAVALLESATYENFVRFVLPYADGVVLSAGEVSADVEQMVRKSGKPLFECSYADEGAMGDVYDKYAAFYDTL